MARAEKPFDPQTNLGESLLLVSELLRWQPPERKTVPLSSLLQAPAHWAALKDVRETVKLSRHARERVHDFVKDQARKTSKDLKLWLGLKPGRPLDFSKRKVWAMAAALRRENPKKYSWSRLTRELDREGFNRDPRGAMDRMRHGVTAVLKERRG